MVELGVTPSPRTEYGYDAAGNLTALKDGENHTTTYAYDSLSRNTSVTQPLGQDVQYSYDSRVELTRFRGHFTVGDGGVHDGREDDPVHTGVQATAGGVGPHGADAGLAVEGVRAFSLDDRALGQAVRARDAGSGAGTPRSGSARSPPASAGMVFRGG